MAVLIEGISVVIRAEALLAAYRGDWDTFRKSVPNETMCADEEIVRVGFMSPADVECYVKILGKIGLTYLENGTARDIAVVDQMRGPAASCKWVEFGHIDMAGDPAKRVAACRHRGSASTAVVCPEGWSYENSLSQSFGFAPTGQIEKSLTFLRHEDGLNVYRNEVTGEDVYVGRSGPVESVSQRRD